jgi:hypothetical protein
MRERFSLFVLKVWFRRSSQQHLVQLQYPEASG